MWQVAIIVGGSNIFRGSSWTGSSELDCSSAYIGYVCYCFSVDFNFKKISFKCFQKLNLNLLSFKFWITMTLSLAQRELSTLSHLSCNRVYHCQFKDVMDFLSYKEKDGVMYF